MHGLRRIAAVMVLVSLAGSAAGVQAFAVTQTEHPAGCHGQMPGVPSPAPTSYQCCANGHHWAVLGPVAVIHPPAAVNFGVDLSCDLVLHDSPRLAAFMVFLSNSPPRNSPLRI